VCVHTITNSIYTRIPTGTVDYEEMALSANYRRIWFSSKEESSALFYLCTKAKIRP
jgi:hypothetical protein